MTKSILCPASDPNSVPARVQIHLRQSSHNTFWILHASTSRLLSAAIVNAVRTESLIRTESLDTADEKVIATGVLVLCSSVTNCVSSLRPFAFRRSCGTWSLDTLVASRRYLSPRSRKQGHILQFLADRVLPKRVAISIFLTEGFGFGFSRNLDTELASSHPILGSNLSDDSVTLAQHMWNPPRKNRLA